MPSTHLLMPNECEVVWVLPVVHAPRGVARHDPHQGEALRPVQLVKHPPDGRAARVPVAGP